MSKLIADQDFFDSRAVTAPMMVRMVPPVLPRNFVAFWKKNQMSTEIHFRRGLEISYEKTQKKSEQQYKDLLKLKLFQVLKNLVKI